MKANLTFGDRQARLYMEVTDRNYRNANLDVNKERVAKHRASRREQEQMAAAKEYVKASRAPSGATAYRDEPEYVRGEEERRAVEEAKEQAL